MLRRRRHDERGGHEIAELAALADGSLATERRSALEQRVASSAELAASLAEQQHAVALARGAAAEVEAPAALRARIEAQQRASREPARRRLVAIGALGAAALAAVVVGLTVLGSSSSGAQLRAALAPTALVPGARGEATLKRTSSGWRIELAARGLPRLAAPRFYEAWLRNSAGVVVPIGTFNEGRKVTLWAGVSPKKFATMIVTREQADGVQAESAETVLAGTVRSESR